VYSSINDLEQLLQDDLQQVLVLELAVLLLLDLRLHSSYSNGWMRGTPELLVSRVPVGSGSGSASLVVWSLRPTGKRICCCYLEWQYLILSSSGLVVRGGEEEEEAHLLIKGKIK